MISQVRYKKDEIYADFICTLYNFLKRKRIQNRFDKYKGFGKEVNCSSQYTISPTTRDISKDRIEKNPQLKTCFSYKLVYKT